MIKINVGRDCLCWETSQLIEGYGPIDWVVYDYSTDPDNGYLGSGLAIFMTDSGNLYRIEYMWDLFLKQSERCAISGVLLNFGETYKDRGTASVDRIDSTKGYVPGNVQWVHKKVNLIKQFLSDEELINWCEKITDHQRNPYEIPRKTGGCDVF